MLAQFFWDTVYSNFRRITHCQVIPTAKRCHFHGLCISLNSLNLICMHGRALEIQEKLQLGPRNASRVQSVATLIILAHHEMPWILLVAMCTGYVCLNASLMTMPGCIYIIFHVWLKQTIRIFLPCKFTAECTNNKIFIILEVGIFQNQNCDLVSVMSQNIMSLS